MIEAVDYLIRKLWFRYMQRLSDNKKLLKKLDKAGVMIIDPDVVYVEGEIKIGQGTTVYPNVYLTDAIIGKDCKIGPVAEIADCKIGDNSSLLFGAQIKRSTVGPNFKMKHHGYIGDAKIGRNVNVGAGFIVCNSDGKNKHQTIIGDNVFLGSNSIVIAPNKIGAGCYIAANSTIRSNTTTGRNNLLICRESELVIKKL